MKLRLPGSLQFQIYCLLALYLACFLLLIFSCFNAQFGIGWEALLKSPAGDRVDAIAEAIDSQLASSNSDAWGRVLGNFEKIYHVHFYLFDGSGRQLSGPEIKLPSAVHNIVAEFPPLPGIPLGSPFGSSPGPSFDFPTAGPPFYSPLGYSPGPPLHYLYGQQPGAPFFYKKNNQALGLEAHELDMQYCEPRGLKPDAQNKTHLGLFPGINVMHQHFREFVHPMVHPHGRFIIRTENPSKFWIGTRFVLWAPSMDHPVPAVLLASTDDLWTSSLLFDVSFVAGTAAAIILTTIAFWYPFILYISRSISEVTLATELIAQGRFDTRLKVRSADELGRLSDAVNRMADKLNSFVKGQKRFLGDISHELFSPLARLHAALELLDESVKGEDRLLIADIREEVEEMNTLLHELLAFSKAGLQGKQAADLKPINLSDAIANVLERLGAEESVNLDVANSINVMADPLLLERSVSNIIRNAVRYAGSCGPIKVSAKISGPEVIVTFADHGPGVSPNLLSQLGEPFFRPESARTRSAGGVGLGLAIVKSCIEACGGTVSFRNRSSGGFEVEVKLKYA